MVLFWAITFVLFVVAELATVQLVSIWLAVGSLAALFCAYYTNASFFGQLIVFIAVSALLLAITLPIIRKKRSGKAIATNSDLDIGQIATVIEEINLDHGTGRVTLNGVDWSAVSDEKSKVIKKGSIVTVKEVQGAKLIVALKDENSAYAVKN